MISRIKFIVASIIICLLIINESLAGQSTTKNQISENIEKIRTGATPAIQKQAIERLDKLTRKIKENDIDNEILNDFVELIDVSEGRTWVSTIFDNLGSHATGVAPKLIPLLITKIRTSKTSNIRYLAIRQIASLINNIKPENINDEILTSLVELIDVPDASFGAAGIVGTFGSRAESAIPKLLQLLITEECRYKSRDGFLGMLDPKFPAIDGIRTSLKRIGAEPPLRELFTTTSCANLDVLKKQIIGEMYGNCEVNNCID